MEQPEIVAIAYTSDFPKQTSLSVRLGLDVTCAWYSLEKASVCANQSECCEREEHGDGDLSRLGVVLPVSLVQSIGPRSKGLLLDLIFVRETARPRPAHCALDNCSRGGTGLGDG